MITLTQEIQRRLAITDHQTITADGTYICASGCGFHMPVGTEDTAGGDWYHQTYANSVQMDFQRGGTIAVQNSEIDAAGWTWEMVGGHGTTTPPGGFLFAGEIFAISPEGVRYKAIPGPLGISNAFYVYTHGLGLNLVPIS